MLLASTQTVTGLKTFLSGMFSLRNIANTFSAFFTNNNTADRTYALQNRNGTLADDTDLALKANIASPTFTGGVTTNVTGASGATPMTATVDSSVATQPAIYGKNATNFAHAGNIGKFENMNA